MGDVRYPTGEAHHPQRVVYAYCRRRPSPEGQRRSRTSRPSAVDVSISEENSPSSSPSDDNVCFIGNYHSSYTVNLPPYFSLAILSIVLGYAIHGTFKATPQSHMQVLDENATRTVDILTPVELGLEKHRGSSLITTSAAVVAISTSSSKPADVAVFSPSTVVASTSSLVIPPPPTASGSSLGTDATDLASAAPAECDCGCGMVTWPGKTHSTDLVLRPSTPAPALITDAHSSGVLGFIGSSRGNVKGKGKATSASTEQDTSLYALSTRIAGSISEYFDFSTLTKMAGQDVRKDMQELLDALDHLAEAISRQTATLWEQSIGTVSTLREEITTHNTRAREKAKQLKKMGERFLGSVGETFRARSGLAKERAHALRNRLTNSDLGEKIYDAVEGSKAKARRIKRKEKRQARKNVRKEKRALRAAAH